MKLLVAVVIGCVACGGGKGGGGIGSSGVNPTKTLPSLTDDDIMDLCEYFIDVFGPQRTIDCGDGSTTTAGTNDPVGDTADCVESFTMNRDEFINCTATVGELEQCFEDQFTDEALCSPDGGTPPSCAPIQNDPDCTNI